MDMNRSKVNIGSSFVYFLSFTLLYNQVEICTIRKDTSSHAVQSVVVLQKKVPSQ